MPIRKSFIGQPYASYTHADPFAPKRWLHQRRFRDALKLLDEYDHASILDYGTGDGHFLELCRERYPASELLGYDPVHRPDKKNGKGSIPLEHDPSRIPRHHFTVVTLLETCEHLPDEELAQTFTTIKSLLTLDGRLVISVPIEIGIPAVMKNLYRAICRKGYERLTFPNYWKAIVGMPFERKVNSIPNGARYIHTHMGFNHIRFEKLLRQHAEIERRIGTPVRVFGVFLNTSLYYVVKMR